MSHRVLVVDDSMMVRAQVRRALTQVGLEVSEAKDGLEALEAIKGGSFSVVVLDVNMPRMSGLELLENLSHDPSNAGSRVIMLTTEGQQDKIARAKELGAKAWILKPFKPELLAAAVKKLAEAA